MKKIPTAQIESGMILGKPVIGSGGNVLLSEGILLKASMISRLSNWGIHFVYILSDEESAEDVTQDSIIEFDTEKLDKVFSDVMDNELMRTIYNATKAYLASKTG